MGAFSEIDLEQSAREETLDETLSEQTVQQNMTAREAISASEPIQRADSPTHNGNTMAAAQDGPEEETNAQSMESVSYTHLYVACKTAFLQNCPRNQSDSGWRRRSASQRWRGECIP